MGTLNISSAHDRDILRHTQAGFPASVDSSDSHRIIGGEYPRRPWFRFQKALHRCPSAIDAEVPLHHPIWIGCELVSFESFQKTASPERCWTDRRSRNVSDTGMANFDQALGCESPHYTIVHSNRREIRFRKEAIH